MPFLKRAKTWFKKDSTPTSEDNDRNEYSEKSPAQRSGSTDTMLCQQSKCTPSPSSDVDGPASMLRASSCPKQRPKSSVPAPWLLSSKYEPRIVHEGPVKRAKFAGKSKNGWTDCYVVLTTTSLVFYKDHRSYLASNPKMKKVGVPSGPAACAAELVLALNKAFVDQCEPTHTKRYSRTLLMKLSSGRYLMQYRTEENARWWLHLIQRNIYQCSHQGEFEYIPMELESDGVTPSAPRLQALKKRSQESLKQEPGASSNPQAPRCTNEETDTVEVLSRDQIKHNLTKFFEEHPPMEHLI